MISDLGSINTVPQGYRATGLPGQRAPVLRVEQDDGRFTLRRCVPVSRRATTLPQTVFEDGRMGFRSVRRQWLMHNG